LGASLLLTACAASGTEAAVPSTIASAAPIAIDVPVTSSQAAFADGSGGMIAPLPAGATFGLTAEQVRQVLLKDGASAAWVALSPALTVSSGWFEALVAPAQGASPRTRPSVSSVGVASYLFTGVVGPCPLPAGGVGSPAPRPADGNNCTGTVVADASSGLIEQVEIGPVAG
jgi:hypothetical protein